MASKYPRKSSRKISPKLDCGTNKAVCSAKSLQSCPTLCDPIDDSALGSPVPGILQARTLEWVTNAFSNKAAYYYKTL